MLTIYRASAGSGKTHQLTGKYLNLLFSKENGYKHILAVTFTNKATEEMKSRIIEELFKLATGEPSDYLDALKKDNRQVEAHVRKQAKKLLVAILHDYSSFNISTIDRFFQQTMRAFTREIGLQGGYGIEMDQEMVLTEVIDNLLADLEKPENKELLGWLLRFAEDKIENGGDWKLSRDIMALAREVFKETYKQNSEKINEYIQDKGSLERFKAELFSIIRTVEEEARKLGEKGLECLNRFGVRPEDFKGGSRSPLLLLGKLAAGEMKEPSQTFINLADNLPGCYTKTTEIAKIQIIGCVFENGLNDCIKGIASLFENLSDYHTAKEIIRFYYTLGILSDISVQLKAYRDEKNIMLIADTTELLNKVIDGSDTPFIYEKTGTSVDHYMIDEFQDTSQMQWQNFKPLISESLSHRQKNLIVGDVKQSIYRFRNSDWRLLDQEVSGSFMPELTDEKTLDKNWRSLPHIIDFNNALFAAAPALLQEMYNEVLAGSTLRESEQDKYKNRIIDAYKDSMQTNPRSGGQKTGHVRIEFLAGGEDTAWKEEALTRLPDIIGQLQQNGYELKDIALLVRTNQEGAMVAETLLRYKEEHPDCPYKYDIISDDALFISSSTSVRFFVALMKYLRNPEEKTNRYMAMYAFNILTGYLANTGKTESFPEEAEQALPALFHYSLYETVENIYRIFSDYFPENEQVFIQAFLDMVSEYSQKEIADPDRFLKWWEESGYRKTIHTPESQNAIRIMTVHKSKGLGFKAVILPFGDWEIDHKPTKPVILWCKPHQVPFNQLPLVPVRYSQNLAKTIFAADYFKEKLYAYIDNLNTLYVAFTRAKEELIVLSPRPRKTDKTGKTEKISSVSQLLWNSIVDQSGKLSAEFDTENGLFNSGDWHIPTAKKEEKGNSEVMMPGLFSVTPDGRLKLRLHSKGFFFDDPRRKHGTLMHEILSLIETPDDIPRVIEQYRSSGVIDEAEHKYLGKKLERLVKLPETTEWFNGTGKILSEADILFEGGFSMRPDRIVIQDGIISIIDYKFGEIKENKHRKQVSRYMELIRRMGYTDVKGYLWYVELNEIEGVE